MPASRKERKRERKENAGLDGNPTLTQKWPPSEDMAPENSKVAGNSCYLVGN